MAGNNIVTSLVYPVKGCDFTYTEEEPNVYKTHKAKVHISSIKVIYQNPIEEVVLSRTQDAFKCLRCDHSTQYPNVMQVSFFFYFFKFINLMVFSETREDVYRSYQTAVSFGTNLHL